MTADAFCPKRSNNYGLTGNLEVRNMLDNDEFGRRYVKAKRENEKATANQLEIRRPVT